MSGRKRRASEPEPPPAKKIKLTITAEAAADKDNFKLIRSLDRNALKPETIAALNRHNYDPFAKEPQVKDIIRSGSISSKCELVESEGTKRPYKIVAKANIAEKECVGVYMGTLIEESRCIEKNLWQYNIPAGRFPKKTRIPSLVLDGSKSANETRFIHNAEWYNKAPNICQVIVWDIATHLPHIIFRAIRDIEAGDDLLLFWNVNESPQPEDNNTNQSDPTNKERDQSNQEESSEENEKQRAAKLKRQAEAEKKRQEAAAKKKQEVEKKRAEQELARLKQAEADKKRQEEEKKILEEKKKIDEAAEKKKQEAEKRQKLQDAVRETKQKQNEEAEKRKAEIAQKKKEAEKNRLEEKRRAEQIAKTKRELEEAEKRIEKIRQKKEEEAKRRADAERKLQEEANGLTSKKAQYGIVKVIPKHTTNLLRSHQDDDLDDEELEIEPVEISKPMTEINFFSEEPVINNSSNYNSSPTKSQINSTMDISFDLNAIVLSDEEEEVV